MKEKPPLVAESDRIFKTLFLGSLACIGVGMAASYEAIKDLIFKPRQEK